MLVSLSHRIFDLNYSNLKINNMKKIFLLSLLSGTLFFISCNDYGKKVKISDTTEVYIKDKATEDDAKHLGNFLDSLSGDAKNQKSFQLSKDDNGYTLKMVIDEDKMKQDPSLDQSFMIIRYMIATEVFPNNPVKMVLTDNTFKEIKTVKDTVYAQ